MKLNESLTVKTASTDDYAVIQSIGHDTYREHFASIWSPEGLEDFLSRDFSQPALLDSLSSPQHLWLIFHGSSGSAIGYAKLNWDKQEPISGMSGAELQKIYFSASATGQGYGSEAIEHIARLASRRHQAAIWLHVLTSNQAGQRFYANAGFSSVGEMWFHTDIAEIKMAAMVRQLADDTSSRTTPFRGEV